MTPASAAMDSSGTSEIAELFGSMPAPPTHATPSRRSWDDSFSGELGDLVTSVGAFQSDFAPLTCRTARGTWQADDSRGAGEGLTPRSTLHSDIKKMRSFDEPAGASTSDVSECVATHSTDGAEEGTIRRWCNYLYTTKCPFCCKTVAHGVQPCKFLHMDAFVRLQNIEKQVKGMPNLMQKHMKGLAREMMKIVNAHVRQVVNTKSVVRAWGAGERGEELNPYAEVVKALRRIGWVVPERDAAAPPSGRLEDAVHGEDIFAILSLVSSCLHFDLQGSANIMIHTVAYVFSLETPTNTTEVDAGGDPLVPSVPTGILEVLAEIEGSDTGSSDGASSPMIPLSNVPSRGAISDDCSSMDASPTFSIASSTVPSPAAGKQSKSQQKRLQKKRLQQQALLEAQTQSLMAQAQNAQLQLPMQLPMGVNMAQLNLLRQQQPLFDLNALHLLNALQMPPASA